MTNNEIMHIDLSVAKVDEHRLLNFMSKNNIKVNIIKAILIGLVTGESKFNGSPLNR